MVDERGPVWHHCEGKNAGGQYEWARPIEQWRHGFKRAGLASTLPMLMAMATKILEDNSGAYVFLIEDADSECMRTSQCRSDDGREM
jgi:hypothetical protein